MHDAYRVDKGGQGTFDNVMRGWRLLQSRTASTSTSCARSTPPTPIIRVEVYRFFRDELEDEVHPVHPDHRARDAGDAAGGQQRLGRARQRPASAVSCSRATRSPSARVAPEQWGRFLIGVFDEWVTRDVGTVFVQMFDAALASWVGAPAGDVHLRRDLRQRRWRSSTTATSTRAITSSSRSTCSATSSRCTCCSWSPRSSSAQFGLAKRDTLPEVLPRVRGAVRLPRRVPEEPLPHDAGRRARPELPVRRLQGVLHAHRSADADDGRPAPPRPLRRRGDGDPGPGTHRPVRQGAAQRTLSVRQRRQVQALPRPEHEPATVTAPALESALERAVSGRRLFARSRAGRCCRWRWSA